ncbi:ABC transporter ATP-binding protein, partial [Isoptericola sp. S6320L]|nr:ABC transporter ATP-binding protein [Isoptericola sp. S6320L]
AAFKSRSKARIEEVRQQAGTVFLVSHSISTIEAMCTRVLWMHQGRLVMDGPVEEVTAAYKTFIRAHRHQG